MAITTKERAVLKAIAANEPTLFQVGKDGVSRQVEEAVDKALTARELIKIRVLNNCEMDIREVCDMLCEHLKCEPVLLVGTKIVLYRFSPKKAKHIDLKNG